MTAAFAKSFGRICRRSHGRIVDLSLSRVSLVGEPLESAIQWQGNSLFCSHRNKRRRMNDRLFPFVSKGQSASAVPAILAGGAAILAIAGILSFHEAPWWQRLLGVMLAIAGLFLLRK
jgi:hypothetical protein